MRKYRYVVYGVLALVWLGVMAWQVGEHRRVVRTVHDAQLDRVHDIANSLAVVIRSQRRFGVVPRPRLVDALGELVKSRELLGIALLSPGGEVVAAGGETIPGDLANLAPGSATRTPERLIVASLVELGPERGPRGESLGQADPKSSGAVVWTPEEGEPGGEHGPPHGPGPPGAPPLPGLSPGPSPLLTPPGDPEAERAQRRQRWEQLRQHHPFWQSPEKYQALYETQGLHMMVLMLDHRLASATEDRDRLARTAVVVLTLVAVLGFGLAWHGINQSAQLQIRLARARAMNSYLRELNLAAAGLAHETRNPLNLVRGIAQTVAGATDTPTAARERLGVVLDEVDRITARLNEFIDYSKPREPQLAAVSPTAVARDVARTLATDFEDKHLQFECQGPDLMVLADATMLRQALFNLLLNATQAVPDRGHVTVCIRPGQATVDLEVVDDGPGVPEAARADIFRPYFTLSDHGTGLGLAVVRQIVLAHGWEIRYEPRPEGGSIFRISGLEPAGRASA